jgi:MoaA/NifB/PqqE/SkfB family radical SAM enzyme
MARIVVELTNRCNLSCGHCFSGRHGGRDDLPLPVLRRILDEAKAHGFDDLSFTGGDPTVHPQFFEIVRLTSEAAYRFGMVTNGWNFAKIYTKLLPYRERLSVLTFSLDGATAEVHDELRGNGSFRRVMQAASVCVAESLPFSVNMVLTAHNRHQMERMTKLAAGLGGRGLRFGHLMPTPLTAQQGLDLSPQQRREVESEIFRLRERSDFPVALAPGYHSEDLFPCDPLALREVNVDCRGNLSKCCHLSGHGDGSGRADVFGNLNEIGFSKAYADLARDNERIRRDKLGHHADGEWRDSDYFPCWYCSLYYRKVDWLGSMRAHAWAEHVRKVRQ